MTDITLNDLLVIRAWYYFFESHDFATPEDHKTIEKIEQLIKETKTGL